jgi:proteasome accessory factor B
VEFDYRKPGEKKANRRRVRPYHLALRENLWYLIGFDPDRAALRTFALPRISRATALAARFVRPADFSPEKFFASALGVLGGAGDFQVRIRFSAAVADRVREREWHESQEWHDLPDGGLELTLQLGALAEIEAWVLSWGADAEVLQPPEFRARLRATAARLSKVYR